MVLAKACKGVLLYTFTCVNKCLFYAIVRFGYAISLS